MAGSTRRCNSVWGQTWRLGGELLILRLRRQPAVRLAVIDDVAQQLEAERCQCALPQFAGGFALLDEAPFLSGDGARIHALGEMIDRAAGDRVTLPDGPFDGRDAPVSRQQRWMIADAAEFGGADGFLAHPGVAVRGNNQ